MFAQDQIMGKIIDNNGMPLLGATVVEKGTSNGTQSDMDGNFTLQITNPQNAILVISDFYNTDKFDQNAVFAVFRVVIFKF